MITLKREINQLTTLFQTPLARSPCSYCYVVIRCNGEANSPVLYRGEDAVEQFLTAMLAEL